MITVSDAWKAAHEQMLLPEMFVEITMDIPEENTSLVFDKNQIISYTHEQSGDPISRELSMSKIEFSLDNSDGRWNLQNPEGVAVYLCEQRKLTVRYGLQLDSGIEWIQAGIFYLSEWKVPSNGLEAKFVAVDAFGVLRNIEFTNYPTDVDTVSSGTVKCYATKEDLFNGNNPTDELDNGTKVTVYECSCEPSSALPDWVGDYSLSRAFRTDRGWIYNLRTPSFQCEVGEMIRLALNILPFYWESLGQSLASSNADTWSIIDDVSGAEFVQATCNAILFAHWQDASGVLRFEIPNKTVGDYTISLDKAYCFPEIEIPKPLGEIVVVGRRSWNHDYNVTATLTAGEGESVIVDNPYLFDCTERGLGYETRQKAWIEAYTPKSILSGEFRADPRLELFDVIQVEDKFGNFHNVMLTHIKYTYSGSFRGTYKGEII